VSWAFGPGHDFFAFAELVVAFGNAFVDSAGESVEKEESERGVRERGWGGCVGAGRGMTHIL
jgi:hypothetical protein